jgi:hypothetical protein
VKATPKSILQANRKDGLSRPGSSVQAVGACEEYLSIADLAERIPYAAQTIRNLMSRGVFKRNVHYVKPRGRVMFKWSVVLAWIEAQQ